jgi:hypothetical protein
VLSVVEGVAGQGEQLTVAAVAAHLSQLREAAAAQVAAAAAAAAAVVPELESASEPEPEPELDGEAAVPRTKAAADSVVVEVLQGMGFPLNACRRASALVGHRSTPEAVDVALEWCLEHAGDADFDRAPSPTLTTADSHGSGGGSRQPLRGRQAKPDPLEAKRRKALLERYLNADAGGECFPRVYWAAVPKALRARRVNRRRRRRQGGQRARWCASKGRRCRRWPGGNEESGADATAGACTACGGGAVQDSVPPPSHKYHDQTLD